MNDCQQCERLLKNGNVRIVTNFGEIELCDLSFTFSNGEMIYNTPFADITVRVYKQNGETSYRTVRLKCKKDITLYKIDFLIDFNFLPKEVIEYKSFINAPSAVFVRFDEIGFYTGVENPFFFSKSDNKSVIVSYEPSLILKDGEEYESEPQFLGKYKQSFEYIAEKAPINLDAVRQRKKRGRFFNPCGEIPLDIAEIDAMRKYVEEYYDVIEKGFDNILYFFFYPKKKLPQTDSEIQDYISTIDRFAEISGDIVAFNPHIETKIPTEEMPYWELAPKGSPAEKIMLHTRQKGLRYGYYMGCAFNGTGGNAALLPFMSHKTEWKKRDAQGNIASENCLGCDEYADWWFEVQKNTIEKYSLGYWSWDPGPGNGNDCYAENHGHIPGKGEYKGWRNSQILLKRLKETFPKLFLMSFYGRKEYGIWGFRYFSQHEVYWEQTVLFGATLHNDLHDDRVNAHGTRLQNQWCMNYRFLPAHIGHGLVTRMGESYFDPEMDKAYDFGGWKYALLSAIACCGSTTLCNIPAKLEQVPGFVEFYNKWITWAKENYRYCSFTKPIGDEVSNNIIDGFTRIDGKSGQIFLFNSSPKIINKKLLLDEKLGINTNEAFYLHFLYCENTDFEQNKVMYRNEYHMGDILDITLPPYGAVVLEMAFNPVQSICEIPRNNHTINNFYDDKGNRFTYPKHSSYDSITLKSNVFFDLELKSVLDNSRVEDEDFLTQKISKWHDDGMPFTFASALPHHLVLYIPFDEFKTPSSIKLKLNDVEVPIETFRLRGTIISQYAFIEPFVKWNEQNVITLEITNLAENSFMGLHVDYPDLCNGMSAEEKVFSENIESSSIHSDPTLVIDSFEMIPSIISSNSERVMFKVKTSVSPSLIENIYFLHPTQPQMPTFKYNSEKNIWECATTTGNRYRNIFCNTKIYARIRGKDGGVGPAVELDVKTHY